MSRIARAARAAKDVARAARRSGEVETEAKIFTADDGSTVMVLGPIVDQGPKAVAHALRTIADFLDQHDAWEPEPGH